jgi:hypothetical protein
MTELIKILLGSEDIVIRDNEDSFLNLELSRAINEIKPDSVENDFDLADQYVKERNDSLKFCIYGTMESKYVDCTNITITVRSSDNDTLITPKIAPSSVRSTSHLITTIPLSKNSTISKNVYGNEKASYFFLFEIDRVSFERKVANKKLSPNAKRTDNIVLSINDQAKKILDSIEIPFIFFDEEGELIPYGTKTSDIDINGNITEINNDFPFFYDRHWIKTNLAPSKMAYMSFAPAGGVVMVPENITGGTFFGEVKLDFPSKSGSESVTVILDKDETIMNPNNDFVFTPQTLQWSTGSVSRKFKVAIINDSFVEGTERVSFKLDNVKNATINNPSDAQFKIDILNDDIPSEARFVDSEIIVSQSAKTVDIKVVFDKPIEVSGQAIDILLQERGTGTTASLGVDFSFGIPNKPGASGRTLPLKQGDTGATLSIDIFDNFGYEVDKTIELHMTNPTQNVAISSKQLNSLKITLADSMIQKFTRYIFPADFEFGHGAFRVNRKVNNEQYEWSLSNNQEAFTNKFSFSIAIINDGEKIVWDGKEVKQGEVVTIQDFPTGMTSPYVIDLPANDTKNSGNDKFYKNTKYTFKFIDILSNVGPLEGANVHSSNVYENVQVFFETKPAGNLGDNKFYLVSEISKINSVYDKTNNSCSSYLTNNLDNIKINGVAFLPKTKLPATTQFGSPVNKTSCQSYFRSKPIQDHCNFNGIFLPFGFSPAANAPYAERFAELSFGDMFVQIGKSITANSKLKLENPSNQTLDPTAFFNWKDASLNFKNDIEMHITNIGTKDVQIFGKDAGEGDTVVIRQSDIGTDFSKMKLRLNGNTAYSLSANSFNEVTYAISFKNINFYDANGQQIGGPLTFTITPFKFPASASTQSTPVYTLISKFDEVDVRTNTNNVFACGGTSFGASEVIDVRGLLFSNSKTSFISANFVENNKDIIPSCPTDVFQFKIV